MDRRPLWPIAIGVAGWIAVGVAVSRGIWWPLWIAIPLSVLPGLGAVVLFVVTRRARRAAPDILAAQDDRSAAAQQEIAEPPRPGKGGTRTNARTAGRRRRDGAALVLVLGGGLVASEGCGRGGVDSAAQPAVVAKGDAKGDATTDAKGDAKTDAAESPEQRALAAALAHAVVPPEGSDATYRVDPFVAVLVFEQIRAKVGPSFTPIGAPVGEGGPSAGYRVAGVVEGSLLHRLGLRDGDVIEAMNDVVLADDKRVAFALDGAENRVDLTIYRDDISLVQSYRLTQSLAWTELLAGLGGGAIAAAAEGGAAPADGGAAPADGGAVDDGRGAGVVPDDGGAPNDGGGAPNDDGADGGSTPSGGTTPRPSGGTTPRPSGGTTPRPSGGTTPPPPSGAEQVRCESSSRCTISRAYFDKMTSSPTAISSQATIVPAIANDVFSGYKLKSVKAGSNVAKLGFQSGDKITHVNGKDVTDDLQAAQIVFALGSTKMFKVRYVRGSASLVKTVVVE